MTIELILTVIGMIGGLLGIWINFNVKIAKIEVEVEHMKNETKNTNLRIDRNEELSREDHLKLSEKLDEIFKLLTIIATEHEIQKCNFKNGKN